MNQNQTLIEAISSAISARINCSLSGNKEWMQKWDERLAQLGQSLPHGSGFDSGTDIITDVRTPDYEIVLDTSFHHMKEGMYDGWTHHRVVIRPTFTGLHIDVKGKDKNQIKDYIADCLHTSLSEPAPEMPWAKEGA